MIRILIGKAWWLNLIVLLGAAAFLGTKIPDLNVNANVEALLDQDDPDFTRYVETREDWGTPTPPHRLSLVRRPIGFS